MSLSGILTFINLKSGKETKEIPSSLALAIGNFDGVHLGHKRLVSAAVEISKKLRTKGENVLSGVFCFSAPPADFLMSSPPPHICTLDRKLEVMAELGADYAVIADFANLCNMEKEDFVSFLRTECKCHSIICGFNFKFGKGGKGDSQTLKAFFGDDALVIDAVTTDDGVPISSSRIRDLVSNGEIEKANSLLGHAFSVEGEVVHGKELGRRLGIPTINQNFSQKSLIPKRGIYVSLAVVDGVRYPAVTNIGKRPTVEEIGKTNCETHLLDFDGELYGKKIRTELLHRIRDEKRFATEDELMEAITGDVLAAREYFKKNG
ncbi:MAG: bifunctional riboflavin kinase/FAD synthetase [Ruminococcaceae bacterium]|nr:bifunctional riboflavin kinase/FAD synthetase [Oscillospiraceae bacterium]